MVIALSILLIINALIAMGQGADILTTINLVLGGIALCLELIGEG